MLSLRGPDGAPKECVAKELTRAMRAVLLRGAHFKGHDEFMGDHSGLPRPALINRIYKRFDGAGREVDPVNSVNDVIEIFAESHDEYPHHWTMHLVHAAEIVGYLHPKYEVRQFWERFYLRMVRAFHMHPETLPQMLDRLRERDSPWKGMDMSPCPTCSHSMCNHDELGACLLCTTFRLGHGMLPGRCVPIKDQELQRAYAKEHS